MWSMLLEEGRLGPLISEVLIPGDGVVLLLSRRRSFHAWSRCETGLGTWRQRLRSLRTPLETSLEISVLVDLWIRSGPRSHVVKSIQN